MKKFLDTLADFTHEDLLTIKVALNEEIKHKEEAIELNESLDGHGIDTVFWLNRYKHEKEVLNKFWDALIDYELER